MFLKTYDGSAEDLSLSFTVANDDFGTNKEIELIPNGANIDVTDSNKHRYIGKLKYSYSWIAVDLLASEQTNFTISSTLQVLSQSTMYAIE